MGHWIKMEDKEIDQLIVDFLKVAKLAGVDIPVRSITTEVLRQPHTPPTELSSGKMAVYVFFWNEVCLKVGKVGPKSQARYTNQHYNPHGSNSTLAKSILKGQKELGLHNLTEPTVGNWIKSNTDRLNIILDVSLGVLVLSLLEVFLQCRLSPKFEGFNSQK